MHSDERPAERIETPLDFAVTGFFLWYGERNHAFRLQNALLVHDWLMYISVFLLLGP